MPRKVAQATGGCERKEIIAHGPSVDELQYFQRPYASRIFEIYPLRLLLLIQFGVCGVFGIGRRFHGIGNSGTSRWHGRSTCTRAALFQPSAATQGIGDNPLELTVDRAELILGPSLQSLHRPCVDTQDKRLVFVSRHGTKGSMVQRSSIDHGLSRLIRTQHDQQVRDHGSLAFLIQGNDLLIGNALKGHMNHRHRPLDNLLAR